MATEGWGVIASLRIYPPFAGAAVSAITLVVAFGFAVSRPCLTLKVGACLSLSYSSFYLALAFLSLRYRICCYWIHFSCNLYCKPTEYAYYSQMMEDAVYFLSKETVVQAITRSATKVSYFLRKDCFISFPFKWKFSA